MNRSLFFLMFILYLLLFLFIFPSNQWNIIPKKKDMYLSDSEKVVIDHGIALYHSLMDHEEDCFRLVTLKLHKGCQSMDIDSLQKREYALMLTMCELSIAQFYIPTQCRHLLSKGMDEQKSDACLKEIAKSNQAWTSYSGYHRNVISICFSVRYPIEKDILNKLHENITLNQVKNFDILNRQQNYMIEWREEEMAHLSNIKDIQHEMHNQFENLKDVNEETIHQMTSIHDRMMDMKHQSQSMMNEHQQSIELYRDKIQNHFHGLVSHQQDTMNGLYDAILSDINGLNSQLQEMVSIQSDAIDAWNEARVSQTEYIHTWESLVVSVNRSMNEIINASMAEIHDMQGDLKEIHYQIGSFIQPIKGFNDLFTLLFSELQRYIKLLFIYSVLFSQLYSIVYNSVGWTNRVFLSSITIAVYYYFTPLPSMMDDIDTFLSLALFFTTHLTICYLTSRTYVTSSRILSTHRRLQRYYSKKVTIRDHPIEDRISSEPPQVVPDIDDPPPSRYYFHRYY